MPWEGECNRCGLCCTQVVNGAPTRCENLRIVSADEATCAKYETRRHGMPIALLDADDRVVKWSYCTPNYPHQLEQTFKLPSNCGYRWVDAVPWDPAKEDA